VLILEILDKILSNSKLDGPFLRPSVIYFSKTYNILAEAASIDDTFYSDVSFVGKEEILRPSSSNSDGGS